MPAQGRNDPPPQNPPSGNPEEMTAGDPSEEFQWDDVLRYINRYDPREKIAHAAGDAGAKLGTAAQAIGVAQGNDLRNMYARYVNEGFAIGKMAMGINPEQLKAAMGPTAEEDEMGGNVYVSGDTIINNAPETTTGRQPNPERRKRRRREDEDPQEPAPVQQQPQPAPPRPWWQSVLPWVLAAGAIGYIISPKPQPQDQDVSGYSVIGISASTPDNGSDSGND